MVEYEKGNLEQAISLMSKSVELKKQINDDSILLSYFSLVELTIDFGDINQAIKYIKEIEQIYTLREGTITFNKFVLLKGKVLVKKGEVNQGILHYTNAMDFFKNRKLWEYINMNAEELGDILFENRKYKKASELYKLAVKAKEMR